MSGIKTEDLRLLITTTLEDLPNQVFEVGWDHVDYEFCRIYQQERMEIDGGESITRFVQLDPGGNATYRRAFDLDNPAINTEMLKINVPWCRIGTNYSWDETELIQNRNNAKGIIKLIDSRRLGEKWGLANLIEERGWKTPDSASDDLNPYGVPYYINMLDADSTTAGFSGQTIRYQGGTTTTTCAGIDASTYTKWKNYAATYSAVDASYLRTLRTAFHATNFKMPQICKDPSDPRVAAKRGYCSVDHIVLLEELLDSRDDNHKANDLMGNVPTAKFGISARTDDTGTVYLNKVPIIPISELDGVTDPVTSDVTDPLYIVDFSKFYPMVMKDYWMREGDPISGGRNQHTTFTVFLDGMHQNMVTNRRKCGFVLHKAITS